MTNEEYLKILMKNKVILLLKGLPASGKSTFAKELVKQGQGKIVRINKDDLRAMIHNSKFSKNREAVILQTRDTLINLFISQEKSIIIDDTNLNPVHEKEISNIAKEYNYTFLVKMFDVSLRECLKRNALRDNPVPDEIISKMYFQYIANKGNLKLIKNDIIKKTFIFDVDGTLANHNGRNPYDLEKLNKDLPNEPLFYLLNLLGLQENNEIIIMSGREKGDNDKHYIATKEWLDKYISVNYQLYMRENKDSRADNIVKKELFEKHLKNKNIICVFDDRNPVVDMWRDLGLQCYQVNYGDF